MNIAIITLNDNNNYGNRLQNYALEKYLKRYFKANVYTIWYDEKKLYMSTINLWNWKSLIKYIINKNDFRRYIRYFYIQDCIRMYNIAKFTKKINTKLDFCLKKNLADKYDYFIVGSDQVWNTNFWFKQNHKEARLLSFAPKKKCIAYAASFGIDKISNKYVNLLKRSLVDMKAISVRENSGRHIIEALINKKVPVLVDPTILLSKEDWENIMIKPEWYCGEEYILTYFLGEPLPMVKNIAKRYNWKIYNLMDKNNLNLYTSRVEEFIYLISHAKLVYTDSFHASVFSIIMNTPFLVFNRKEKNMKNMSSRINTLLNLFNFNDRYVVNGTCDLSIEKILNMDFNNVKNICNIELKKTTEYLQEAMDFNLKE